MPSDISWCDETWNPWTGCTKVSDGCLNCYIARQPPMRMAGRRFDEPGIGGTTGVILHHTRFGLPLKWRRPRQVFVNSQSDFFHDAVPAAAIARAFAVMATTAQHTYLILTKRHARMRSLLTGRESGAEHFPDMVEEATAEFTHAGLDHWPLPNVWLGVSVENRQTAELRLPALQRTPAAVKFASCEPLLGPVDLRPWLSLECPICGRRSLWTNGRSIRAGDECEEFWCPMCGAEEPLEICGPPVLDWVIIGGESGPGPHVRAMDPAWARDLLLQCDASTTAAYVKQLGAVWARDHGGTDRKGSIPAHWPPDLRVQTYPGTTATTAGAR